MLDDFICFKVVDQSMINYKILVNFKIELLYFGFLDIWQILWFFTYINECQPQRLNLTLNLFIYIAQVST